MHTTCIYRARRLCLDTVPSLLTHYPHPHPADDLVLLPLLIWAAIAFIPPDTMEAARRRAEQEPLRLSRNWLTAVLIFLMVGGMDRVWITKLVKVGIRDCGEDRATGSPPCSYS